MIPLQELLAEEYRSGSVLAQYSGLLGLLRTALSRVKLEAEAELTRERAQLVVFPASERERQVFLAIVVEPSRKVTFVADLTADAEQLESLEILSSQKLVDITAKVAARRLGVASKDFS